MTFPGEKMLEYPNFKNTDQNSSRQNKYLDFKHSASAVCICRLETAKETCYIYFKFRPGHITDPANILHKKCKKLPITRIGYVCHQG